MNDTLRALNVPRPMQVREDAAAQPLAVRVTLTLARARARPWMSVTAVMDTWRIDDEWWRDRPISRMYHRMMLQDGATMTLFKDLVTGTWWRQEG